MFKYPKSSLFVLLLSANLLVPFHSDFIFGSISSNFDFFDIFTSAINPLSFLFQKVFLSFGEAGLGILQLLGFFLLALYTFYVMNLWKTFPLSLVLTLMCVGTFQYGQDFHPAQTFYFILLTVIFISKIEMSQNSEKILWRLIFPAALFILILVDWRNLYWGVIGLALVESGKRALLAKKMLLGVFFILIVFFLSSGFRDYLIQSIQTGLLISYRLNWEMLTFGSLGWGLNFDFAFLLILFGLFAIYNYKNASFYRDVFFVLGLFVVSLYSYQFKVYLGLWLSVKILRSHNRNQRNERVENLSDAFHKFEKFIGRLSAEGLIFLFLSILFVSIVSFIKLPLTEAMFPVAAIDSLVEEGKCPAACARNMEGYLKYRFQHNDNCREGIVGSRKSVLGNDECELSISNYDRYPDRWR